MAKRLCAVTVLGLLFAICATAQVAPVPGEKRPTARSSAFTGS